MTTSKLRPSRQPEPGSEPALGVDAEHLPLVQTPPLMSGSAVARSLAQIDRVVQLWCSTALTEGLLTSLMCWSTNLR